MAYRVSKINYCYAMVSSRAGQGVKILSALKDAGVNLIAVSGFPAKGGKSQLDLVPEKMADLRRVAKKHAWKLSVTKKGFLVRGDDEIGAALKPLQKLADNKINVTAADAVAAGKGRYGMLLWVKPKDYNRAARILNAK